jgi:magnesium transporter
MDQEQLAQLFSEKHLLAIPIVDDTGHMKGIVTADDIVNVVEEEASEDIQKIGGTEALDGPYLEVDFSRWSASVAAGLPRCSSGRC